MTSSSWSLHAGKTLVAGAVITGIGAVLGYPGQAFLAALLIFLAWHFINTWRLYAWTRNPGRPVPNSIGIWKEIFDHVGAMEQRNKTQMVRYQSMIADFENVTDAFPDASLIIDKNDNLTWFNKAAGALLDLDEAQSIGRPVTNLIRDSSFSSWLAARDKVHVGLEMPAPGNDNIWLEITAFAIREDQHLIILRDASEVHNLERIRRDFVTNVSHELRTPLTVMRGYLEILRDRPGDELSDAHDRMHTQAIQMQNMLDDLLELSRLQSVETDSVDEYVDVPAMLLQLKEQAEEISRGDHVLVFDVEEGLGLSGIKSDIESAFRNLIINALKYTPRGGSVSVNWHDSSHGATLSVVDTGIGIPQREIPRLTERFYRVGSDRGRQTGGTGIGLAIVKHVLNGHQARLEIESVFGVGSQFTCIFPPKRTRI